jgi:hypothetical protein
MALLMEAVTGAMPRAMSTGNVTSVPEPTTLLMVPAHNPAKNMKTPLSNSTLG